MTPMILQQFRLFYATDRPLGVVFWAFVDEETEKRLAEGTTKLRPQDWKSGNKLWVVESLPRTASCYDAKRSGVVAPFGGAEEMVKDLKEKVFPDRTIKLRALTPAGQAEVRVL